MGSTVRLTMDARRDVANAAREAAVRVFEDVERELSRFEPDSALSRLNRSAGSGRFVAVPPVVRTSLVLAERARRLSSGMFDPRIIHALEAAGERAGVELPREDLRSEPWLRVRRDGHVALATPVDLGGLGKGLALRRAAAGLRRLRGLGGFLLDAGGDLAAHGRPADGNAWRIAIEDPIRPTRVVAGLEVGDLAVATSSVAVRRWRTAAGPAHHIIDPRTGHPAETGLVAVTVATADPVWAEVWSKALLIAGSAEIEAAARHRRLAAWWVADDGRVVASPSVLNLERFRLAPA